MAGWELEPEDVRRAVRHGSVTAGLMTEQVELPNLTKEGDRWNGETVEGPLREMEARDDLEAAKASG